MMLQFLAGTFALLAVAAPAFAWCGSADIGVWPESGDIPLNARFVVDAYGEYVESLRTIQPCDLSLAAEDHSVCLVPETYSAGEVRIGQLVLVPQTELVAGVSYALAVKAEGLPTADRWSDAKNGPFEPNWTISRPPGSPIHGQATPFILTLGAERGSV